VIVDNTFFRDDNKRVDRALFFNLAWVCFITETQPRYRYALQAIAQFDVLPVLTIFAFDA
jgi:hypothetical protein